MKTMELRPPGAWPRMAHEDRENNDFAPCIQIEGSHHIAENEGLAAGPERNS